MQVSFKKYNGMDALMLVIRNVSQAVRTETLKSEFKYQQLMVKTMSHE